MKLKKLLILLIVAVLIVFLLFLPFLYGYIQFNFILKESITAENIFQIYDHVNDCKIQLDDVGKEELIDEILNSSHYAGFHMNFDHTFGPEFGKVYQIQFLDRGDISIFISENENLNGILVGNDLIDILFNDRIFKILSK